jgi:hypothetical protein
MSWDDKDDEHDYNCGYYEGRKNYDCRRRDRPLHLKGWIAGKKVAEPLTSKRPESMLDLAASQGAAYQIAMELKL